MFLTIVTLVLAAAIVVFFSEEFAGLIKKIISIPGMKLLIPLVLVSWVCIEFESWINLALVSANQYTEFVLKLIKDTLPFTKAATPVARIIFLIVLTMVPVILLDWINKRKTHRPLEHRYLISTVIFIVIVMVMLVI